MKINGIEQNIASTYNGLKALLRLSIAGLFIVASLNYIFNDLIKSLDNKTINSTNELKILRYAQKLILDARYTFTKMAIMIDENELDRYKNQTIKSTEESDYLIKILKFGGEVDSFNLTYEPINQVTSPSIIADTYISKDIANYSNKFKKLILKREKLINSKTYEKILEALKIQQNINNLLSKSSKTFDKRLTNINDAIAEVNDRFKNLNQEIASKQETYFYAQVLIFFFIVISLVYSSKPIRKKILDTNIKLHKVNKKMLKLADENQKANRAKSEFLANMSHEIRTPLNAILGFIELLREREDDKEKLSFLQTIHSSSYTLLGIINDILDFSKIESGNITIEKTDFNVEEEFRGVVELFKAKASEKSIDLSLVLDPNIPSALHGDPLRIKQVIANLLSNAIKFTPRNGKVVLTIKYKNKKLFVRVADTGIGIDKEKQKDIFKAFSQAESSTTRKYGGTGLGLTISSKLVALMGGELKLESKKGEGSSFYFDLDVEVGEYKREKRSDEADTKILKNRRVLLVEDNKPNQMFMSLILKKLEMEFDIANDGVEAIGRFKKGSYNLILMDENMPNLNGIEATKHILKIEKDEKRVHTPIIALTANALKGDREKFLDAGMDEYLTKPVTKERLVEKISLFFSQKESV